MTRARQAGGRNVYKDIGVPNAEEHFVKAQLVFKIDTLMKKRGLKQKEAADLFGVRQPDISKMLSGEFRQFSVERLLRFLVALNQDVEIVVKPHRSKNNAPALIIHKGGGKMLLEERTKMLEARGKMTPEERAKELLERFPSWKREIETMRRIVREMEIPEVTLDANEFECGVLTFKVYLTIAQDDWVFFLVTHKIAEAGEHLKQKVEQQIGKTRDGTWKAAASDRSGCVSEWVFEPNLGHWTQKRVTDPETEK